MMFIYTFSIGNCGRGGGGVKEFNFNLKKYAYIDKIVKVT